MRKQLVFFHLLLATSGLQAFAKSEFLLQLNARYANHLIKTYEQASHELGLTLSQKYEFGDWTFIASGESRSESAYAANPGRYNTTLAKRDSSNFILRDTYIQYFPGMLQFRLGYQQVVWGEAFGTFFADVVNPKDLREIGLRELSQTRLQMPIANIKLIGKMASLQLIATPGPQFNKWPLPTSDFFDWPVSYEVLPVTTINVNPEVKRETDERKFGQEAGARATMLLGTFDFSAFTFSGYDRQPFYTVTSYDPAAETISMQPRSAFYHLYGTTMTADFEWLLLRLEGVYHTQRTLNYFEGQNLSFQRVGETVGVLGLDFPGLNKWQLGFQYSVDQLRTKDPNFLQSREQQTLMARLGYDWKDTKIELQSSVGMRDKMSLLQGKLTHVLTKTSEIDLGADYIDGVAGTPGARLRNASRIYVKVRLKESEIQ